MNQYSYFQGLNGSMSVAPAPAAPFTEAQADRLADAAMSFEIVNGRAVQVYTTAGAPLPGTTER